MRHTLRQDQFGHSPTKHGLQQRHACTTPHTCTPASCTVHPCLWYAGHAHCLPNTDSQCSDYDPKPRPVENRTRTTCLPHVYLIPKTQPDPRRNLSSTDMTHTDATHTEITRSSRGNHDHEHPDQQFTAKSPFRWFPSSNPGDEPQRNLTEHHHRRKWIWGSRNNVPFQALARACGARGLLSIELQENA